MEKKYITIKASLTDQGTTVNPNISFMEDGHTVHHNFQHIILELNLNATGISFLNYICERMNADDNLILINGSFKAEYIAFAEQISGKAPTTKTLENYINKFVEKHLLIKRLDSTLLYIVNPKYFSKGSKTARKKLLQRLLSTEYDGKINKEALLNKPFMSFFIKKQT
jgi:hypothetical protein